jgi:hypothetical protein
MRKIDDLLDTLREARRYVRSNPCEARRLALEAQTALILMMANDQTSFSIRLYENLLVGVYFLLVAPDVLGGYIDGAILEIQDFASKEIA